NINHVDLGLRTDNVVTFALAPGLNGYSPARSQQLLESVEDALAKIPAVTRASGNMVPILAGDTWSNSVSVEGFTAAPDTNSNSNVNEIAPGYFATVGIQMLGRGDFTRADTMGAPKVAIVNESFAKKFNLMPNPVGKRMGGGGSSSALDTEIIGFVKDSKYNQVKG